MDVEMGNALGGGGAVIDDEAEALREVELFRDHAGGEDEMAEDGLVGGRGFLDAWDDFFRNDEQVDGRLRLDVVEDDAVLVLVFDLGGDFTVDNALENG